jgi:hypothetical protein
MLPSQSSKKKELYQAAERGWCLHPLTPCGKVPLLKKWTTRATSDASQLACWEEEFPGCNWGVVTGTKSGLLVVDCDGESGLNWLEARVEDGEALPESWAVTTDRGLHLYFELPAGLSIANSVGKIAVGVDIRAEGGYVVAPPSIHPSGKQYIIIDSSCPVSPAPDWLLNTIQLEPLAAVQPARSPMRYDVLPEGERNDGLTRYAGALRRRGRSQREIETYLLEANYRRCMPPLSDAEVIKIAASVSRYPVGGPDPLEQAWQSTCTGTYVNRYERFIAFVGHLQAQRPSLDIALPLKRIADFFGVHFTAVAQWRKKAVASGALIATKEYRPHRRAGLYRLAEHL